MMYKFFPMFISICAYMSIKTKMLAVLSGRQCHQNTDVSWQNIIYTCFCLTLHVCTITNFISLASQSLPILLKTMYSTVRSFATLRVTCIPHARTVQDLLPFSARDWDFSAVIQQSKVIPYRTDFTLLLHLNCHCTYNFSALMYIIFT